MRDAALIAVICLILAFASLTPPALAQSSTAAATEPIPSTFFGVSVYALNVSPAWPLSIPVGTLGKTGGTEWNDLEPANGTYNWTPLDNSIAAGESARITTFMYTFWSTPSWASSNASQSCILTSIENVTGCAAPPAHVGDWDAFVKALVSRYAGKIQYFELWNEANLAETWSGNVSQMVRLAQHAYDDIKQLDTSAIVIGPSISRVGIEPYAPNCNPSECWLAEYLRAGGGAYADAISFHPYACFENDSACADLGIACPQGEIEACAGAPIETMAADIRSVMATYGLSKPLFVTEGGFPGAIISQNLLGTSAQQAAYVSRWYIVQASENISTAVWFTEFPPQAGGLAGFGEPSAGKATNEAYVQTRLWLVGSVTEGPCSLAVDGMWACNLVLSSGSAAQIVFADSGPNTISYVPPAGEFTSYQDLNGTVYPIAGPITVGIGPLLLASAPANVTSTTSATSSTSTNSSATSTNSSTTSSSQSATVSTSSSSTTAVSATTQTSPTASSTSSASSSESSSSSLVMSYLVLVFVNGIVLSGLALRGTVNGRRNTRLL